MLVNGLSRLFGWGERSDEHSQRGVGVRDCVECGGLLLMVDVDGGCSRPSRVPAG